MDNCKNQETTNFKVYITYQKLNIYILFLLFLVLPVDMVNGVLLENNVNLPISVSQLYKIIILALMLFKLYFSSDAMRFVYVIFGSLFLGSIVQSITTLDFGFLFSDFIKVTKYLSLYIAYCFFKGIFKENDEKTISMVFKWITFSYGVLAFNILLKLLKLGYPMYEYDNVGTRGYFYAGNEISALLLVLSSVLAYKYWSIENKKLKFLLFFIFNIFLGVLVASKTCVLGVFVVFLWIAVDFKSINFKTIKTILMSLLFVLPLLVYFTYKAILNSPVMERLSYFWEKLDFMTFIFSSRNLFAEKMFIMYEHEFSLIQKLIGGGQGFYESKLTHIIEIDFLDIFFAHGYLGASLLVILIGFAIIQSYLLKNSNYNPFAKLSFIMAVLLLLVSSIAGHVFNSGIAGNFIGLVLAIMFLKKDEKQIS